MTHPSAIPVNRDVPTFSVVDAVTPVGAAPCAECRGAIVDTYFEVDQSVICAPCHARISAGSSGATPNGQIGRAMAFGVLAALAAAAGYIAILATTGRELTVLVLLVGLIVGKAVRIGSRARGGRRFQWLAMALTYLAIATTYVPFVVKGYSRLSARTTPVERVSAPDVAGSFLAVAITPEPVAPPRASLGTAAVGFSGLILLAIAAPLLESAHNLFTTLVTILALVQAWRMNRRANLRISGPYQVRALSA